MGFAAGPDDSTLGRKDPPPGCGGPSQWDLDGSVHHSPGCRFHIFLAAGCRIVWSIDWGHFQGMGQLSRLKLGGLGGTTLRWPRPCRRCWISLKWATIRRWRPGSRSRCWLMMVLFGVGNFQAPTNRKGWIMALENWGGDHGIPKEAEKHSVSTALSSDLFIWNTLPNGRTCFEKALMLCLYGHRGKLLWPLVAPYKTLADRWKHIPRPLFSHRLFVVITICFLMRLQKALLRQAHGGREVGNLKQPFHWLIMAFASHSCWSKCKWSRFLPNNCSTEAQTLNKNPTSSPPKFVGLKKYPPPQSHGPQKASPNPSTLQNFA